MRGGEFILSEIGLTNKNDLAQRKHNSAIL